MTTSTMTRKEIGIVAKADRAERRIEFIASAQVTDRDGDVVVTAGIDISNRLPLLAFHDPRQPIGTIERLSRGTLADGTTPALLGMASGVSPGASPSTDGLWNLIADGALFAVSIGFMPKKADARKVLLDQTGVTFWEVELLEVSVVSVASNRAALIQRKDFPGLTSPLADAPQSPALCERCGGALSEPPKRDPETAIRAAFQNVAQECTIRDAFRQGPKSHHAQAILDAFKRE